MVDYLNVQDAVRNAPLKQDKEHSVSQNKALLTLLSKRENESDSVPQKQKDLSVSTMTDLLTKEEKNEESMTDSVSPVDLLTSGLKKIKPLISESDEDKEDDGDEWD